MKSSVRMLGMLVMVTSIAAGCSSTSLLKDPGRLIGRPRATTQVGRVLGLWEASFGSGVDGKPSRGFAGQVLFFGPKGNAGARVDGRIRITQYDHYDVEQEDLTPLHTFEFDSSAWAMHGSDGTLGHAYNVFIPYMNDHNNPVWCGVCVEYISPDGYPVKSEISRVMLPGRKTSSAAVSGIQRDVIRQGQFRPKTTVDSRQPETDGERQLNSMTIQMPTH